MAQVLYACLILLPLGISLRMSLRLLYGARGSQVGDPIFQVVSAASWALTIVPTITLILVGTNLFSGILLLVAALSGLEMILARRAMQRRSVWDLLNGSLGSGQPAALDLQNHQGRFTGIVGRSFRSLTLALQQGADLPTAIGRYHRALPEEAQAYAAIHAMTATNRAELDAPATARQTYTPGTTYSAAGQHLYQRFAYLCTVLLVMLVAVIFLAIRIIPSYQAIFEDFELDLPAITIYLISICDPLNNWYLATILLSGVGGTVLLALLIAVMYLCDVAVLRPVTDRLFFTKHRALVLRLFAFAAERGQSFSVLLHQLTEGEQRYPSRYTRRRLDEVGKAISAGQDWKGALRTASFIKTSDLPMLATAQQADNLPWVLRMLADQKVRTMIFRWSAAEKIVFPLAIMLVGLVVLWICVGLFLPLVDLIYNLA